MRITFAKGCLISTIFSALCSWMCAMSVAQSIQGHRGVAVFFLVVAFIDFAVAMILLFSAINERKR
jgi:hypothetical protein